MKIYSITNGFIRSGSEGLPYLIHRLVDDYLDGLLGMGNTWPECLNLRSQREKEEEKILD